MGVRAHAAYDTNKGTKGGSALVSGGSPEAEAGEDEEGLLQPLVAACLGVPRHGAATAQTRAHSRGYVP